MKKHAFGVMDTSGWATSQDVQLLSRLRERTRSGNPMQPADRQQFQPLEKARESIATCHLEFNPEDFPPLPRLDGSRLAEIEKLPALGGTIPPFCHRGRIGRGLARLVARPILFFLRFLTKHQTIVNDALSSTAASCLGSVELLRRRTESLHRASNVVVSDLGHIVERQAAEIHDLHERSTVQADMLAEATRLLEVLRMQQASFQRSAEASDADLHRLVAEILNAVTQHDARIRGIENDSNELAQRFSNLTSQVESKIAQGNEAIDDLRGHVASTQEHLVMAAQRAEALTGTITETAARVDGLARRYDDASRLSMELRDVVGDLDDRVGATRDGIAEGLEELRAELQRRAEASQALLEKHVSEINDRLDFARREALFELRYGNLAPEGAPPSGTEPRSSVPAGLQDARNKKLRLNVGCGHLRLGDYVNVDRRDLPGVDIIAEAADIPAEPGSIEEIYSAHLLEHFSHEELRRRILPHWRTLIRPGGAVRAVVPDAEAMISAYVGGEISLEDLREVTFGTQDYNDNFHFTMFTPESLCDLLEEAGFTEVRCPARARRNGKCFEFEVVARKPKRAPSTKSLPPATAIEGSNVPASRRRRPARMSK